MLKLIVLVVLILAVLLPASVAASNDTQTCVYTTHNVRSVYSDISGRLRPQTLTEVARAHNTTAASVRSLNPNTVLSPLMVGQQLNVWHCDAQLPAPTPRPRTTPWSGPWRLIIR